MIRRVQKGRHSRLYEKIQPRYDFSGIVEVPYSVVFEVTEQDYGNKVLYEVTITYIDNLNKATRAMDARNLRGIKFYSQEEAEEWIARNGKFIADYIKNFLKEELYVFGYIDMRDLERDFPGILRKEHYAYYGIL